MRKREILAFGYAGGCAMLWGLIAAIEAGWFHVGSTPEKSGLAYNFQTLISGIIAIFAAFIGAAAVFDQTMKTERRERERREVAEGRLQERREKHETATRAKLPHLLNAVHVYLQSTIDTLNTLAASAKGGAIPHLGASFPRLDSNLIDAIAATSEDVDLPAQAAMTDILIGLQVINARNESMARALDPSSPGHILVVPSNLDENARYIGGVEARYYALYEYGRFIPDKSVPQFVVAGDALTALRILGYARQEQIEQRTTDAEKPIRFVSALG